MNPFRNPGGVTVDVIRSEFVSLLNGYAGVEGVSMPDEHSLVLYLSCPTGVERINLIPYFDERTKEWTCLVLVGNASFQETLLELSETLKRIFVRSVSFIVWG